jgi:hypothetical protein
VASHKLNLKSLAVKILPSAAFVILFLLFVHWNKQSSPNRDDAKLKELQQISSEMPVPSSFSEVSTNFSSRGMDAGVYKTYRSPASYGDVKRFYSERLITKGWILRREKNHESWIIDTDGKDLEFQKGDMYIIIEYNGTKGNNSWNYAVNYVWRNN